MKLVKNCLSILFCLAAFSQTALSQATLSIQGIIQKSNGAAVDDGNYDLTFKLYPASSGGTAVHSETITTAVTGGIYSAELGAGSTALSAAFDQTYYLGVSVNGGAELVPRTRLTSSPYALSLLGTTNLFPGGGSVGIGTISPTSGYNLHVKNPSSPLKVLFEGESGTQIDFKRGTVAAASLGFSYPNSWEFVLNPGPVQTHFQYNGTNKMVVYSDGVNIAGTMATTSNVIANGKMAVGQSNVDANNAFKVLGNSYFSGFLEINGGMGINSDLYGFDAGGALRFVGVANRTFSMKASNFIGAPGFWNISDQRIKKDFRGSDALADLSMLQKLRVVDYRYVDVATKGTSFNKGFIAQEVEQTFPEAVNQSTDFIPNVYSMSAKTQLAAGKMIISMEKGHGFAIGDEVKLMLPDGEKIVAVAAVPNENSFSVNWDAPNADRVFVYGKKVNDFHTVDYDRIFTLNVSATQELARQVEALKKENAALKAENGQMKASAEKFDARLRALEKSMMNEK